VPAAARALTGVLLAIPLHGCYLMQAAGGQLEVARASRPIEQVLAGGDLDAASVGSSSS
jgi:hypothetical protein